MTIIFFIEPIFKRFNCFFNWNAKRERSSTICSLSRREEAQSKPGCRNSMRVSHRHQGQSQEAGGKPRRSLNLSRESHTACEPALPHGLPLPSLSFWANTLKNQRPTFDNVLTTFMTWFLLAVEIPSQESSMSQTALWGMPHCLVTPWDAPCRLTASSRHDSSTPKQADVLGKAAAEDQRTWAFAIHIEILYFSRKCTRAAFILKVLHLSRYICIWSSRLPNFYIS